MTTTKLLRQITENTHPDGENGGIEMLSVDGQLKSMLHSGKPVTIRKIAAKLGNGHAEQISATLDRWTTEGILFRFRVGLNYYYAPLKVALTVREPTLRSALSDSVKNLFIRLQYKATGKSN